jgi:hypothetical protein
MLVLAERFDVPAYVPDYKYAIGIWRDHHQKQSYFYFAHTHEFYQPPHSQIFRLRLGEPTSNNCWESVVKVNFYCKHATISPCGNFIWSMEITKGLIQLHWQLIFRQINLKSRECEQFEMLGKEIYSIN